MDKRGDVASLIKWLVIALISFFIILFLILTLGWKQQSQIQVCHESVVIRASTVIDDTATVKTPLRCKTEKICITTGNKQNCDDDFLGETYDKIEVKGNKNEKQDAINKIIATKLEECWWMMGGHQNLNVYGREASTKLHCNICSRIAFSQQVKDELDNELNGTNKYLLTHKGQYIDGTYWQFITNNPSNYMEGYDPRNEEQDKLEFTPKAVIYSEYNFGKEVEWITKGSFVIVGSFCPIVGPVLGAGVGGLIAKSDFGGDISGFISGLFNKEDKNIFSSAMLVEYNKEELRKRECTSLEGSL